MPPPKKKAAKKKQKRTVQAGIACVRVSPNNTLVTITDDKGDTLVSRSAGSAGFSGSRKSTPYAAQMAAEAAATAAKEQFGMERVRVKIRGVGPGREQGLRGLCVAGLELDAIIDRTHLPHGGCRPRGPRKV